MSAIQTRRRTLRLASLRSCLLLVVLAIFASQPLHAHDPACCESRAVHTVDEGSCDAVAAGSVAAGSVAVGSLADLPLDLPAYRQRLEAYYYSGRYEEEISAVVAEARSYLEARLKEGVEKPAMVLDIDETSLSNWAEMQSLQFGYDPGLWREWVETASAYPIGPTLELARWAKGEGVELFFITGRGEKERDATEKNLTAVGYAPWHTVYLEDESECCTGESCDLAATCKSFYRKQISDQGYSIVINLGDQRSGSPGRLVGAQLQAAQSVLFRALVDRPPPGGLVRW